MHLLTTLLLAHLLADFPLQTNALAKLKRASLTGVFIHVLIYVLITTLVMREPARYWALIGGLGGVHFLIDSIKMRYTHEQHEQVPPRQRARYFCLRFPPIATKFRNLLLCAGPMFPFFVNRPCGIFGNSLLFQAAPEYFAL